MALWVPKHTLVEQAGFGGRGSHMFYLGGLICDLEGEIKVRDGVVS